MTVKTATDAMRRKAGAGRPPPEIGRMTAARAWQAAMPRAAEGALGIQASILQVAEERRVREALGDLVAEHALLVLLEGPEDRYGIAMIPSAVLQGLIEAATTGHVASRSALPRPPTPTDALIAADLLDALLEGFETALAEMSEAPNLAGYRYAAPVADVRAMGMALAEGPYSVFRLETHLGGGARQGEAVFAFPVAPQRAARGGDVAAFQQALTENVLAAPTQLDASLARLQLPLSEVAGLAPGAILRVPLSALAAVGVEAAGGPRLATARLGQQGGFRAVRIVRLEDDALDPAEAPEFEEAAPHCAPAALPPADPGAGPVATDPPSFGDECPELPPLAD